MAAAIVTVCAQLLLLDAAIETFRSGSPLRWWLSPPALLFVALVVWLWHRHGSWASCVKWSGAASASMLALLLLLVASAWLPGGQVDGVQLLGQSTSTLLIVVTAAGVTLGAVSLVRSRTLGRSTSLVVAGLTVYSVAALVVAIGQHTSYQAIFRGESLWTWLPFFLQGAFLGAVAIVPLSLVVEVVSAVRRMHNPWRPQQLVALVMTVVIAASGVFAPSDTGPTLPVGTATPLAIPSGAGVQSVPPFSPRLPEKSSYEPEQLAAESDRLAQQVPAVRYNLVTRASQLGPGIDDAFRLVRDEIRYEPYAGILRGSAGTYAARAGNAVDRSLLLATLLKWKQIPTRFAVGRLSPGDATRLLNHVFDRPATEPDSTAVKNGPGAGPAPDLIQRLYARARHDYAVVRAALGRNLPRATKPSREELLAEIEQHVWVQAEVGGRWIDLDTAFPDATPNKAYASAEQVFEAPTDAMCQHVTLRVIVETVADGELQREKVLEAPFNVLDLIDTEVFLLHRPVGGGLSAPTVGGADQWTPVLWVDGEEVAGQPVTFGAATQSIQNILGGNESTSEFVAEWLEIELALPNGQREVSRRALIDRAGAAWRKSPRQAAELRKLARNANGVKAPQAAHNIWFSAGPHDLATYTGTLNRLTHALHRRTPSDEELSPDTVLRLAAFQNFAWLLATDHLIVPALDDADHRFYADSPRVTILTVGSDPFEEDDRILSQADLRRDHLRGLTRSGDGQGIAERKLWFAVLEGALEHEMIAEQAAQAGDDPSHVTSTSSLLGDEGVVVVTAADTAEASKLVSSVETRERLAAALADGDTVIIPRRALRGGEAGWWAIAAGSADVRPVLGPDLHESWNYVKVTANRYAYRVDAANPGIDLRVPNDMPDQVVERRLQARIAARETRAARVAAEQAKKNRGGTEYNTLLFIITISAMGLIGFGAWYAINKLVGYLVVLSTS
jgi:hypothetical protein